jgi:hypothetical protein
MTIGSTYERTAPCGRVITITPNNQKEVEYYRSLEDIGYKYKQQFNVFVSDNSCIACEG